MFVHYQFFHERSTGHGDLAPHRIGTVKGYINTHEFDSTPYRKKVEADSDLKNLKKAPQPGPGS
ncbi:MAG: hypothetical protein WDA72_07320 [Desulfomonilia bacterium]|jgi:hypothetical protein|nr:hypothetical protein [Deltaproteobacteria bacterium]MDX9762668.1 hypothetical protein [Desulfomonilia bacterium]HPW70156.1 hypothetical protein [Deltaproteobacteria bacterium]